MRGGVGVDSPRRTHAERVIFKSLVPHRPRGLQRQNVIALPQSTRRDFHG